MGKEGGIGIILGVESSIYRRLALIQQFLVLTQNHPLGLSPRTLLSPSQQLRTAPSLIPTQPLTSTPFLYLPLLLSFLWLDVYERNQILDMINQGTTSSTEKTKQQQQQQQQPTTDDENHKKVRLTEEQIKSDLNKLLWSFSQLLKQL